MKKKLLAVRETFQHCAFREECCQEHPELDAESCSRCSVAALEERIRRSRSSSN
jgi:hypothetical protein